MDRLNRKYKHNEKMIFMIAIASTLGLIPIILDNIPNAPAQNTFMTRSTKWIRSTRYKWWLPFLMSR